MGAVELARAAEALGAGELMLNCIDQDGTNQAGATSKDCEHGALEDRMQLRHRPGVTSQRSFRWRPIPISHTSLLELLQFVCVAGHCERSAGL